MEKMHPILIKRYLAGACSDEEQRQVEKWLNDPINFEEVKDLFDESTKLDEEKKLWLYESKNDVWNDIKRKAGLAKCQTNSKSFSSFRKIKPIKISLGLITTRRKIAAAMLCGVLIFIFATYYYIQFRSVVVKTTYGQVLKIVLPDNTVAYLNGNSQLTYTPSWAGKDREVWLEGEGFFKVTHLKSHKKFTVHLSDKTKIEVLGTEFNVYSRIRKKEIFLKSGKIKLSVCEKDNRKDIFLTPGDLVFTDRNNSSMMQKRKVDPQIYYGWVNNKWVLNDTPLEEMISKLKDTYGITVIVNDIFLSEKRASGSIPIQENNFRTIVSDIANIFELKMHVKGDSIYLEASK